MVKMILLLQRRADMSAADFKNYYETRHAVLGRKLLHNALRYQRRYLQGMGAGAGEPYDSMTEVWSADQAAMEAALGRAAEPENAALLAADEANLFDRSKIRFYVVSDELASA